MISVIIKKQINLHYLFKLILIKSIKILLNYS